MEIFTFLRVCLILLQFKHIPFKHTPGSFWPLCFAFLQNMPFTWDALAVFSLLVQRPFSRMICISLSFSFLICNMLELEYIFKFSAFFQFLNSVSLVALWVSCSHTQPIVVFFKNHKLLNSWGLGSFWFLQGHGQKSINLLKRPLFKFQVRPLALDNSLLRSYFLIYTILLIVVRSEIRYLKHVAH